MRKFLSFLKHLFFAKKEKKSKTIKMDGILIKIEDGVVTLLSDKQLSDEDLLSIMRRVSDEL